LKAFASLILIKRLEPLISMLQLMKLRASSLITINEGSRLSLIITNEEANKRLEEQRGLSNKEARASHFIIRINEG
jgi:hypothetical protein